MRLLLDECVPRKFKDALPGHNVRTAREMGWSGKQNGELLTLMGEHRFEAFISVDQNVEFQQNVKASGIAVVVLAASTNRLKELRPLALHFVKPAALPRETTAKLNGLMDKRHVADYRPYIAIGAEDVAEFRPWIVGFVREVLKLLGKSAPVAEAAALQRAVDDFEKVRLE